MLDGHLSDLLITFVAPVSVGEVMHLSLVIGSLSLVTSHNSNIAPPNSNLSRGLIRKSVHTCVSVQGL